MYEPGYIVRLRCVLPGLEKERYCVYNNIRAWRHYRGYEQTELGEAIGLRQTSVSNLERGGSCYVETALSLAAFLDVPVEDLFVRVTPPLTIIDVFPGELEVTLQGGGPRWRVGWSDVYEIVWHPSQEREGVA